MNDPLMTDDLAELLAQFPAGVLHEIVAILKESNSYSLFPATRAYEAHAVEPGGDLHRHVPAIAGEILWWGSNDLQRQVGYRPDWREIVANTARQVDVKGDELAKAAPAWRLERALVLKALADWEVLDPERRAASVEEAGGALGALPAGILAVGSAAVRLGGPKLVPLLSAKLGAGAALGATVAPLALALAAGWAAHELAGPAFRVLRPVVLTVALTRFRLRDERAAAMFGDEP